MAGREVAASTSNILTDEEIHFVGTSPVKPKKRKREEHKWQRNVRKRSILRGEGYVSTSGKLIPAKAIAPNCPCKRKCTSKFSKEMKENFLEAFHNMKDKVSQDAYLSGLISCHNIQRRRHDLNLKWWKNNVLLQGRKIANVIWMKQTQ